MLTEKFARTGTEVFLTGVAYTDTDGDDFYSVGEAEAGLSFTVGGQTSLSAAAGGYQIALPAAAGTVVQITGSGGLDAVVSVDLAGGNVKLDLVDRTWIASSGDMTLVSGVADGRLLGVADLSLTGSDAANRLSGNKGDNLIAGGAGDDLLSGGAGADTLDGGPGRDTAGYVEAAAGVFVRLWSGEGLSGEAAGDVLTGIENLRGSGFADTLVGDGGVNELFGEGGADALWAGDGDDVLSGGAGADVLQGQGGSDTASYAEAPGGVFVRLWSGEGLSGEAAGDVLVGIENLRGSGFADTLVGDDGDNVLSGGGGVDALWAGDGDDVLSGGAGADLLQGQDGTDTASYAEAAGGVFVRLWSGEGLSGEAAGDVLVGIENLRGSAFADTLVGDGGDNVLTGGGGAMRFGPVMATTFCRAGPARTCCKGRAGPTPPVMQRPRRASSCASGPARASPAKRRATRWWGSRTSWARPSPIRWWATALRTGSMAARAPTRSGLATATTSCRVVRGTMRSSGRAGRIPSCSSTMAVRTRSWVGRTASTCSLST
jgi:Ca2+-binding RTX toxin-like protein